jgi:hypothetical protein
MLWFDDSMSHGHSGSSFLLFTTLSYRSGRRTSYLNKDTVSSSSIHILSGRGSSPFTESYSFKSYCGGGWRGCWRDSWKNSQLSAHTGGVLSSIGLTSNFVHPLRRDESWSRQGYDIDASRPANVDREPPYSHPRSIP